jgi:hypothetical protein
VDVKLRANSSDKIQVVDDALVTVGVRVQLYTTFGDWAHMTDVMGSLSKANCCVTGGTAYSEKTTHLAISVAMK